MKDFKGAIFDLDGTLLDSMWVWRDIDIRFLAKRGYEVTMDYIEEISAKNFKAAAEYTIERFKLSENPQDIIEEWHEMACDAYAKEVLLKPGAKQYLYQLKKRGIKLAVATASAESLFKPALINNGIYDCFETFVTADEVKRGKGFPDIYIKAAENLKLEIKDCVVYEDIFKGIEGAKAGNFYTVGIYDKHSEYEQEKIKKLADLYITDFKQLLD